MLYKNRGDKIELDILDANGRPTNGTILVVAQSGYGKTFLSEKLLECYYNMGYTIICLADPKDEVELGFSMFKAEGEHLKKLREKGFETEEKPVKIYHPFTFNIPKRKLPEFNLYTLSLKDLGKEEWKLMLEKDYEDDNMRNIVNATQNISNNDGIYSFVNYISERIEGKRIGKMLRPDPNNFWLQATGGTAKTTGDIGNIFQPFKKDYFLAPHNSPLNINWEELINDNKHYHVFTTKWIDDKKLQNFITAVILNKVIKTSKDHAKYPILFYFPDIKNLTPFKPRGDKYFLAQNIKDSLAMTRSSGRGMVSIMDSQNYFGIDEEVRNSATETYFGKLGGLSDVDRISKSRGYSSKIRDMLFKGMENKRGVRGFLKLGKERITMFPFFPLSMHKEEYYNFIEMYEKHFPDKMKSYADLVKLMDEKYQNEYKEYQTKSERVEKEEELRLENRQKEKEEAKTLETTKIKENLNKLKKESTLHKQKEVYDYVIAKFGSENNKDLKWRQIGRDFGIDVKTAQRYFREYKKYLEEQANQNIVDNSSQ